jgi:hypothetical protein
MRNTALLLATLVTVACSVDHLVLAALDEAGGANAGGSSAGAGSSGLSAGAAGNVSAGGSQTDSAAARGGSAQGGMDRIILGSAGGNVDIRIGGDAGATSQLVCSCLGTQAEVCGSDGVTYAAGCEDAGDCVLPTIACWHACPCLAGESAEPDTASWFSLDCAATAPCADGVVCMTFSNVTPDMHTCTTADN